MASISMAICRSFFMGGALLLLLVFSCSTANAQMKTGNSMKDFNKAFRLSDKPGFRNLKITLIKTNAPGCMYYPDEKPVLTFQAENLSDKPLSISGRCDFVKFATLGIPGDIWLPRVEIIKELQPLSVELTIPAKGYVNFDLNPQLPLEKGGYGLILDLGDYGRNFIVGIARVFEPNPQRLQYPKQSLDTMDAAVLERLGVQAIRKGCSYVNTLLPEYSVQRKKLDEELDQYKKHNVTVALQFESGKYQTPLDDGAPRTYLDDNNVMKGRKGDLCWMPQDDQDFEEFVYRILCKHGWPKGQVTAVLLWNEPWEGVSISGWGADMLRYRSIYKHMANAVLRAQKDAGVDVLVGGADSSSNALDKLFADGSKEFLPIYDFCSIHYQGMSAPVLYKMWNQRTSRKGRVLIWDTESWVANSDDRIAGLVASNRAAGYDRSLGVFFGNICTQLSHERIIKDNIRTGTKERKKNVRPLYAWPPAATISAVQHFIGEREFSEILIKNSLPWIYVFKGMDNNPTDGTVVIVGDIGQLFNTNQMLYRTVRSLEEAKEKMAAHRQLQKLPADDPQRIELSKCLSDIKPFSGVSLTLDNHAHEFSLYDFYGNEIKNTGDKLTIPLDSRGFFLRVKPDKEGAFDRLLYSLKSSRVEGLQPIEIIAHDIQDSLQKKPSIRLICTNMLNRNVKGKVDIRIPGLKLQAPQTLEFLPYEKREIEVKILDGQEAANNSYPLSVEFDAGEDGAAALYENLHINRIHRKKITVDGKLDDWKGTYPQVIQASGKSARSLTEAAWLPFVSFDSDKTSGYACGYLAYDDEYFYFAAKVADSTPDAGTLRFANRDDDTFFYPDVCYRHKGNDKKAAKDGKDDLLELRWKEGVRHYSYRRSPVLPDGSASHKDNIQIAFNAIQEDQELDWDVCLPGRMPRFITYKCTDYEYALNKVAEEFGGGTEVWRLQVPGMLRKHFYPRQPKHPKEGAVKDAKLAITHEGGTRITEVAIPWSELPDVKKLLDAGKTVKFSYRVNDNAGGPLMELARDRSVSRHNNPAFHPDWQEHWANEVEFSFEK